MKQCTCMQSGTPTACTQPHPSFKTLLTTFHVPVMYSCDKQLAPKLMSSPSKLNFWTYNQVKHTHQLRNRSLSHGTMNMAYKVKVTCSYRYQVLCNFNSSYHRKWAGTGTIHTLAVFQTNQLVKNIVKLYHVHFLQKFNVNKIQ